MRASLPASAYDIEIRIGGAGGTVATMRLELGGGTNPWLLASLAVAAVVLTAFAVPAVRRRLRQREGGVPRDGESHVDS
jgi:membrane protein implicated in regulation of membrane protease activity